MCAAAGADDPRPVDERPLLQREGLRPDDPCRRRPARDADHDDDRRAGSSGCPTDLLGLADDVADDRGQDEGQDERREDQEEVGDAHQHARRSVRRRSPPTIPITAPRRTVMTVASRPMTIEMRAPWTVRFSMSRPSSSVPEDVGRRIGGDERAAGRGDRGLERPDEEAAGRARGPMKKTRITTPNSPSGRRDEAGAMKSRWPPPPRAAARRRARARRGRSGRSCPDPRIEAAVDDVGGEVGQRRPRCSGAGRCPAGRDSRGPLRASTVSVPRPGQLKTTSTVIAPATT